jgi:predicted DNA-binding transcriptional regulator AlpA
VGKRRRGTAANPVLSIVRIDPDTNEIVATIQDVSGPLAVGGGALWAVDRAGARAGPGGSTLLRIDPGTNQVAARIPLGVALWDIEVGEGYVWVLTFEPDQGEGDILQVDPRTNEVVARIDMPIPGSVFAPALGEGSAWVPVCCVDNELNLVRVDVSSGQVVGEPTNVTQSGAPVAVAAGHVWMVAEDGALHGLNVATSEVDETVSGFGWPAGTFPNPPAEFDDNRLAVWVANYRESVTKIDLAASSTTDPLVIEIAPSEVRDGKSLAPRFQASYRGTTIPLGAIETPGSEPFDWQRQTLVRREGPGSTIPGPTLRADRPASMIAVPPLRRGGACGAASAAQDGQTVTRTVTRTPTVHLVELAEILGVTHQRASVIARGADFPRPVGRGGQSRLWDRREVTAWAKVWRREKLWRYANDPHTVRV